MQKTLEQYDNVTSKCKALFEKKMYDYGSAWRILRLSSLSFLKPLVKYPPMQAPCFY